MSGGGGFAVLIGAGGGGGGGAQKYRKLCSQFASERPAGSSLTSRALPDTSPLRLVWQWLMRCELVETHGRNVPSVLEEMQRRTVPNTHLADVVFSTTHKAKGLGWRHVYLAGDFPWVRHGTL